MPDKLSPVARAISMVASHSPSFDESGAIPEHVEAYWSLLRKHPELPRLKAIRSNPGLQQQGINGMWVGDGVIELNAAITNRSQLERLLLHELEHAKGTFDEGRASLAEHNVMVPSHGPMPHYVSAGEKPKP